MSTNEGITRILVSAKQLNEILTRHPEVEIALMNKAVPQITDLIKKKLDSSGIKNRIAGDIDRFLTDRYQNYHMPPAVQKRINDAIDAALTPAVIKAAVDVAVARMDVAIDNHLNKHSPHIRATVEQKVRNLVLFSAKETMKDIKR